jgi:hypothetical protein
MRFEMLTEQNLRLSGNRDVIGEAKQYGILDDDLDFFWNILIETVAQIISVGFGIVAILYDFPLLLAGRESGICLF